MEMKICKNDNETDTDPFRATNEELSEGFYTDYYYYQQPSEKERLMVASVSPRLGAISIIPKGVPLYER